MDFLTTVTKYIDDQYLIAGLIALSCLLGYFLRFRQHADASAENAAKLLMEMLEKAQIESRAQIVSLQSDNNRLYKELQAIWSAHDEGKIKCALEIQRLEMRVSHLESN